MKTYIISDCHINEQKDLSHTNLDKLEKFLQARIIEDCKVIMAGDGVERLTRNDPKKLNEMEVIKLITFLVKADKMIVLYGNHDETDKGLSFNYYGSEYQDDQIFVWHGHQYDFFCKNGWWDNIGMFFVWAWSKVTMKNPDLSLWSKIINDSKRKNKFNEKMISLSLKKRKIVVCGHIHQADEMIVYGNSGSWVKGSAEYILHDSDTNSITLGNL